MCPFDSVTCRFCHSSDALKFVVATLGYIVHFCDDCQIYQTSPLVATQAIASELPWDDKIWHLMNRLSWGRVIRERTEQLRRILPLTGDQSYQSLRILDIGAGTADMLSAARSLGIGSVVAMDLSLLNCTEMNRSGIPVVQADAESMPFTSQSFDIVTLCQVIEHVDYAQPMLEQIFSLLRPGGILHIDTPTPDNMFARATKYRMAASFGSEHVTLFTRDSLARLLESVGFEIVGFQGYTNSFHLAGFLVYALTGLRHRKVWSKAAAEKLVRLTTSEAVPTNDLARIERDTRLRWLRNGIVLANWTLRIGIGYAVAPVWNPIARSLSQRPDMLVLMEMQARRPLVTDA